MVLGLKRKPCPTGCTIGNKEISSGDNSLGILGKCGESQCECDFVPFVQKAGPPFVKPAYFSVVRVTDEDKAREM